MIKSYYNHCVEELKKSDSHALLRTALVFGKSLNNIKYEMKREGNRKKRPKKPKVIRAK